MPPIFIIDFDSTLVTVESLDELATIALAQHKDKVALTKQIAAITKAGMEGTIDFPTSLSKRMVLFQPTPDDIAQLTKLLKQRITPSARRNRQFFQDNRERIYVITGGFKDYLQPVLQDFGIAADHILANTFTYGKSGTITGYDATNPLAQLHGKVKAVRSLGLTGTVCVIGDGVTDYEVKEQGQADLFYAFTENVARGNIATKADAILRSFDELVQMYRPPTSSPRVAATPKALLLENISPQAAAQLAGAGYAVEVLKGALSEAELIKKMPDISLLGIRSKTEITAQVLAAAKRLDAIGAFCIGTNQIDLSAAAHHGVAIFNAPYSNTRSVVELIVGEIIMLFRKVFAVSATAHQGRWRKSAVGCFEVRGKKLGIIGYGSIGSQLSVLAENLGMQVYFYDTTDKLALGNARKCSTLNELFAQVDVLTVHVDGAKANQNLIDEAAFRQMKDGVLFLNASRGHVVDIEALARAIKSGKVAGCAIDVFPVEPKGNDEPLHSPLQGLPNVILTPHIGGSTEEAQKHIGEFVSDKLVQYLRTGNTTLAVGFPNLSLPAQENVCRLVHIHQNIPGMLANINAVLAAAKINITGQYLQTNQAIGYVITDVSGQINRSVLDKLAAVPGTIKTRVL